MHGRRPQKHIMGSEPQAEDRDLIYWRLFFFFFLQRHVVLMGVCES